MSCDIPNPDETEEKRRMCDSPARRGGGTRAHLRLRLGQQAAPGGWARQRPGCPGFGIWWEEPCAAAVYLAVFVLLVFKARYADPASQRSSASKGIVSFQHQASRPTWRYSMQAAGWECPCFVVLWVPCHTDPFQFDPPCVLWLPWKGQYTQCGLAKRSHSLENSDLGSTALPLPLDMHGQLSHFPLASVSAAAFHIWARCGEGHIHFSLPCGYFMLIPILRGAGHLWPLGSMYIHIPLLGIPCCSGGAAHQLAGQIHCLRTGNHGSGIPRK